MKWIVDLFLQVIIFVNSVIFLAKEDLKRNHSKVISPGLPHLTSCTLFLENLLLFSWTLMKADLQWITEVIISGAKLRGDWEWGWKPSLSLWRCHTMSPGQVFSFRSPHIQWHHTACHSNTLPLLLLKIRAYFHLLSKETFCGHIFLVSLGRCYC